MKFSISELLKNHKPLVGMIHLPALPGYPTFKGMDFIIKKALIDLKTLEDAGFDGVLVENDNDQPHQIHVTDSIRLAFSTVMRELLKQATIPVGMEIIYDMTTTVEVADSVNASFVRLDVFADSIRTKWGIIHSQAPEIYELMNSLGCKVPLLADIQVKHGVMVKPRSITESALESIKYRASGLIVTGDWTGEPPTLEDCRSIKSVASNTPIFIGSGFSSENAESFLPFIDGIIVGTSIKSGDYIDNKKAKELVKIVKSYKL